MAMIAHTHIRLAQEGVARIDDANAKVSTEIFGRENRLEVFTWKKSYDGGAKSKYIVNQNELVLCSARDSLRLPLFELPPDPQALRYYKHKDEHFARRGPYRLQPLATTSQEIWPEKQWQWSEDRIRLAMANNGLVFTRRGGGYSVSCKQYLRDEEDDERRRKPASVIDGFFTQHGTYESVGLFGQAAKFQFPKPEALIRYLLEFGPSPGDWVLDSFAGSGTTGAVA